METRTCRGPCGKVRTINCFNFTGHGHRRHTCNSCRRARDRRNVRLNNRPVSLLRDCRRSDSKKGRIGNNLNSEWIASQIEKPCSYCGSEDAFMTLDRKDNSKAHTIDNCVPSCIRCNYIRGDMPYEAWLHIVPSLRSAVELGLLGDWKFRGKSSMPISGI